MSRRREPYTRQELLHYLHVATAALREIRDLSIQESGTIDDASCIAGRAFCVVPTPNDVLQALLDEEKNA